MGRGDFEVGKGKKMSEFSGVLRREFFGVFLG